jgi:uncharacterized protein YecE (DUF72 family)
MAAGQVFRIGCSGWQYKHWKGDFYPAELPQNAWLDFYASHFDTVEINNTFYRLPAEGVFESWRQRTPQGFLFAVKASRFLTHMKKLKDPAEPVERLFSRAFELRGKLGPVLYQLSRMPRNLDRLAAFLEVLPPRVKHAIEFRDPAWYDPEVMLLLRKHHVALCLHDMPGSIAPRLLTASFTYLRFHGSGVRYGGTYSQHQLDNWAEWLVNCGVSAFIYFNNDIGGQAPKDAQRLKARLIGGPSPALNVEESGSIPDGSTHPTGDRSIAGGARRRA